ncbi:MAG TPA: RNase H family protein, partial [Oculatellaceae cyanobacterium]
QIMQDPTVQHVELWTDGSSKTITHDDEDGKRRKKIETRLGSGIRAVKDGDRENYLDLAWRIEGVGSIMGAELAPLAKVLKWAHESKRITVYMDSQAGIDAYQKAAAQQYTEREIVNSKDRNVIYMIRQAILKKPSLANNVRLIKVVSHTGDWGNEAADSLAELGALDDEATSFHRIREGLEFRLINLETNKPMYGNIRKQLKQIQQAKHCEALQACSAQGEFARTWAKETTPRKTGAHELMLSNKRQTNMVLAIQQQRAKWKIPAQGNEDSNKYLCKVCKRETSNADHKLSCMAGVQRMGLAELKLEFARVEKPCESEIHPNLQTTVRARGDHCVIGSARFSIESVTVLSHGYWTVADVKADRQQGFKTAMTREYAKAMAANTGDPSSVSIPSCVSSLIISAGVTRWCSVRKVCLLARAAVSFTGSSVPVAAMALVYSLVSAVLNPCWRSAFTSASVQYPWESTVTDSMLNCADPITQ